MPSIRACAAWGSCCVYEWVKFTHQTKEKPRLPSRADAVTSKKFSIMALFEILLYALILVVVEKF